MEKNDETVGEVVALGTEGEGIIYTEGTTAFVPFCLIGERVEYRAVKVKGRIAYGKLLRVERPSAFRVSPPCPVFEKCGGCSLQHMSYPVQLEWKRDLVKNALYKLGGIDAEVDRTVPCEKQYRYRNKLVLPIGTDGNGKTVCGFFAQRSHRIVPVSDCMIQSEWIRKVISAVTRFADEKNLPPFDGERGTLRHIVVREVSGKYVFILVSAVKIDVAPLISLLERDFQDFTFLLNVHPLNTNVIFGKEWLLCRGKGFLDAEEGGIRFSVGANTFMQVNDGVRDKLYARVLDEAQDVDVAVDLYSGGGMLTAMLAKRCGKAFGIEIVPEATRCADELKERNGLAGRMFNICGAVEDNLGVIDDDVGEKSVIVCDPPRKGMERSVVKAISRSGAGKVVLISCNPSTLARDLGVLLGTLKEENGVLVRCDRPESPYRLISVTPFDMFPQTKHVETLVTLFHKKPDSHIEVTVDFENGKIKKDDIIKRAESEKPKQKVTYKMIQDYIEQTYGFKVHTAYIAEVKRDLGLPMYDAPNAVEELKRPRAHPTPRMVEAIKETLKHFEIT